MWRNFEPASAKGCGSLGFRVDDGAAGQVVRFRWETSTPEANN